MKPTFLVSSVLLLAVPLFVACAGPNLSSDADDLRGQLAEIDGVIDISLDYTEPVTLDSGKLALTVKMADDADPGTVVEVVTEAYEAFADTHHDEEGDLDVEVGDDAIHLRSFKPDAEVDAVKQAATEAVSAFSGRAVRAEINTQDVSSAPHVFTQFIVTVTEATAQAVLDELATLESAHSDVPDAAWRVQVADGDGWLIGADHGFPDAAEKMLFEQLSAGVPEGMAVGMFAPDFVSARVARDVAPREVSAAVERHFLLLADVDDLFYDVDSPNGINSFSSDGECFFGTDRLGVRLERDHGHRCSKIKHDSEY